MSAPGAARPSASPAPGPAPVEGSLRVFIAVPVPAAARDAVDALLAPLRDGAGSRRARWVGIEALHLTLRFVGPWPASRVPELGDRLQALASATAAFDVALGGAGGFPSPLRPRVAWLGIRSGAAELAALAARLEDPLAALGQDAEYRPYRAHLTVARLDAVPRPAAAALVDELVGRADGLEIAFRADRLVLYRSHLGRGPARYEPLVEAPFAT